jgi:SAM-dependent methyltransferase
MTNAPFDALAADYDRAFSHAPIGRRLRDRAHKWMEPIFAPGSRALELGCGTGEDALWLARRGVNVLATDASPAMLEQTRAKTAANPNVTIAPLDLNALPDDCAGPFGGALANFGALNCVRDRRQLAAWLAARMMPGSHAAFAVMGPVCLWEIGWHGLHGELRTAARRLHGPSLYQPDGTSASIAVDYPSPSTLTREFAPCFRRTALRGLGLFLPPSDAFCVVERRPALLRTLTALENHLGGNKASAWLADHYWIELVRTETTAQP